MNVALLDWKIKHDEEKQYTEPYMYGLNLSPCFHFKINLSFFTKYEFIKAHQISAEDFIHVIVYMNKIRERYSKTISKTENIGNWINRLNDFRNSTKNMNILVHTDIRCGKDGYIVPITNANNPYIYRSGSFHTVLLVTSLWKKFYKMHKNQIDNLFYERDLYVN